MTDISIVICTYNPVLSTFQRVLASIRALTLPSDCLIECCLVDNNSNPAIAEFDCVRHFLTSMPNARLVLETKQGLSAARMAGVKSTSAPVIVFLDDDNQPQPDYLVVLVDLLKHYPQVGVWGPGEVNVEFTEEVAPWVQAYKWLYQERRNDTVAFGTEQHWTPHHPPGTGQIVRRTVMVQYEELVNSKTATLTGRNGGSLSSGEDAQIVYTAIKNGYAVGVAPELVLHHLIPRKRTHINYLKRLLYNIMSSGAIANIEIFPNQKAYYYANIQSSRTVATTLIRIAGSSLRDRSLTDFQMNSGSYLGKLAGSYLVTHGKLPFWLVLSVRLLNLEQRPSRH